MSEFLKRSQLCRRHFYLIQRGTVVARGLEKRSIGLPSVETCAKVRKDGKVLRTLGRPR